MPDEIVEFSPEIIVAAIDLVAQASQPSSGRHIEWIKRRLRDAVKFVGEHGTDHPDRAAYYALAMPVFQTATSMGGMIGDGRIN